MENRKIKDSWSKIKPDNATHERILKNILDRKHTGETRKGKVYNMAIKPMRILAPIAACLIVALAISIPMLLNNGGGSPLSNPINNGGSSTSTIESPSTQPIQPIDPSQPPVVENPVVLPAIHMNSFAEHNSDRSYYDPETTYSETWDWSRVVEYFGKDITPDYLMPGLQINPWIETHNENTVILNNDGSIAYDGIWLEYYTEYPYEDGSQAIGGNSTGIRIIASKMEGINDCVVWEENMEESLLSDVIVRFGHRSIGYG
ncbi:MAG: hypothetical protein FWH57_13050, partial [Oscillospiraceae bacterium]|nr:hypothetical protein [Oscillospiraceae bacterium]